MKLAHLVMVSFLWFLTFTVAQAQEILVWEEEGSETSKPGKYEDFPLKPGLPTNWTKPINYAGGRLYVRFDILRCPTNRSGALQFAFMQKPNATMIHNKYVRYSGTGRYLGEEAMRELHEGSPPVNWSRSVPRGKIFWLGAQKGDASGDHTGRAVKDDLAEFFPLKFRCTVVVVARGTRFSGWNNYPVPGEGIYGGLSYKDLKKLRKVARAWKAGMLGPAMKSAESHLKSRDPETREEARKIMEAGRRHVDSERAYLEKLKGHDLNKALAGLIELAKNLRPMPLAKELITQAKAWQKEASGKGRSKK